MHHPEGKDTLKHLEDRPVSGLGGQLAVSRRTPRFSLLASVLLGAGARSPAAAAALPRAQRTGQQGKRQVACESTPQVVRAAQKAKTIGCASTSGFALLHAHPHVAVATGHSESPEKAAKSQLRTQTDSEAELPPRIKSIPPDKPLAAMVWVDAAPALHCGGDLRKD